MAEQPMNNQQRRRAENEVVFRQRNDAMKNLAKEVLSHSKVELSLSFTCECSDEECRETILLTIKEYESLRHTNRDFIIKPGHEQKDIESVVWHDDVPSEFSIVKKFIQPPPTDGTLNRTKIS